MKVLLAEPSHPPLPPRCCAEDSTPLLHRRVDPAGPPPLPHLSVVEDAAPQSRAPNLKGGGEEVDWNKEARTMATRDGTERDRGRRGLRRRQHRAEETSPG